MAFICVSCYTAINCWTLFDVCASVLLGCHFEELHIINKFKPVNRGKVNVGLKNSSVYQLITECEWIFGISGCDELFLRLFTYIIKIYIKTLIRTMSIISIRMDDDGTFFLLRQRTNIDIVHHRTDILSIGNTNSWSVWDENRVNRIHTKKEKETSHSNAVVYEMLTKMLQRTINIQPSTTTIWTLRSRIYLYICVCAVLCMCICAALFRYENGKTWLL